MRVNASAADSPVAPEVEDHYFAAVVGEFHRPAVNVLPLDLRGRLAGELKTELEPFLDERGRPEEPFRGVVRRLEEQHERRLRRAEREFLDWSLLSLAAYWRDVVLAESGGDTALIINLDLDVGDGRWAPSAAAQAWGAVEEARADLADETNLNARLVLEKLFLRVSALAA